MILALLAGLLALAPPQAAQNNAVIEGRVLRAGTMDPVPNVQVTLLKASPSGTGLNVDAATAADSLQNLIAANPGLSQATIDSLAASREQALGLAPGTLLLMMGQRNSTLTDAAGRYSFKDQTPGKYTVRAVLDGFFGPPLNGVPATNVTKSITVEAEKPVPAVDIFMAKGGIISGQIRDPRGQPVSGVSVSATRVTYSNGRPQWTNANAKQTNDRGEYRIFWVGPGEYYVGVTPQTTINSVLEAVNAVPGAQSTWARTFYPGVTDPTSAAALTVKDGSEIPGIDFTIQAIASTQTFKITGKVINTLPAPTTATGAVDSIISSFILSPREPGILDSVNPPSVSNSLPVAARQNGEFEIRNVRPGSYDLIPYYSAPVTAGPPPTAPAPATPQPQPMRRYYIDRARVDVGNADVSGITLEIQKGTEIRGKVINQGTATVPLDKIRINLHSKDTIPEAFATIIGAIAVDASGGFAAVDIAAAKYTLQITGFPDTAYVADIRQGGTSIFDTWLTVSAQPVTLIEILLNSNGGTIEGNVQGPERKPAANATVVLVPTADHRQNATKYKTAQTDETGNFSMKAIPPGEYSLFAWESVQPTAWMNAEFLSKYQSRGRPVTATQGTRLEAQLELIQDSINRQ